MKQSKAITYTQKHNKILCVDLPLKERIAMAKQYLAISQKR